MNIHLGTTMVRRRLIETKGRKDDSSLTLPKLIIACVVVGLFWWGIVTLWVSFP